MKPWNELTDLEKRETIALRLGWIYSSGKNWIFPPNRKHIRVSSVAKLPTWPTNDGLAFVEVCPKIIAAKEIRITEKGLEIEMPEKQLEKLETPPLPEVKKYEH